MECRCNAIKTEMLIADHLAILTKFLAETTAGSLPTFQVPQTYSQERVLCNIHMHVLGRTAYTHANETRKVAPHE